MKIKSADENLSDYLMMKSSNDMLDLATPLNEIMKITHFSYHKVYKDNSRVHLSTHANFIEEFHKNKFYSLASTALPFESYKTGYYIVDNIISEDLRTVINCSKKLFDYSHPFMVIKKTGEYAEFYYFSTSADNYQANNFYLNNTELFEKFILYFKSKAADLLVKINQERFVYPTQKIKSENDTNPFLVPFSNRSIDYQHQIKLDRYFITELNVWLTFREIQCLSLIRKGYTAKAIGRILNISSRTVESYTNALKVKLKKPSRLALAYDLDVFFPYLI